jgi:hypothetical protein
MLGTHEKMGSQMIEIITSMNQRYYDLIGKDCVDSFLRHWPSSHGLTVYVEHMVLPVDERIKIIDFDDLEPDYTVFQADPDCNQSEKKFAKKAYTIMHAMHHSKADWIVWLDADVISVADMPEQLWTALLDQQHLSLYMGVNYTSDKSGKKGAWLVPETGVFAVNTRHPDFATLRDEYCRRYRERDRSGLRRFYDNDVLGVAIRAVPNATHRDLCAGFLKPYKTPLPHTVLGKYLIHFKAKHSKAEYGQEPVDEDQ